MIRPITLICALLFVGTGFYNYVAKDATQRLERQIEKTVRETDAIREQARMLHTEWQMLNDMERLRGFSDRYLALKPVDLKQFSSMTDLASRLPPPRAPEPDPGPDAILATPTALTLLGAPLSARAAQYIAPIPDSTLVIVAEDILPIPPLPVPPPPASAFPPSAFPPSGASAVAALVPTARPAAPRPLLQAEASPIRPPLQAQETRMAAASGQVGSGTPRPSTGAPSTGAPSTGARAHYQPAAAPPPYQGTSMLGLSQGGYQGAPPLPLPRPVPMPATVYVGGG